MNQYNNGAQDNLMKTLADLPLTNEQAEAAKAGEYARHEGAFMGNLFSSTPVAK
jgi:hypothetical protein